jgi:hypothetical protein
MIAEEERLLVASTIPKNTGSLSSAEPYEFLVKLRNITWEINYVIVSQNALGMMGRRKLHFVNHRSHPPRRAPLNVLYYPYIIPTNPISFRLCGGE